MNVETDVQPHLKTQAKVTGIYYVLSVNLEKIKQFLDAK